MYSSPGSKRQVKSVTRLRGDMRKTALGIIVMNLNRESIKRERERQQRFQATFQAAPVAMAICDLEGVIVEVNPAFSRMLGYAGEELNKVNIFCVSPLSCELRASPGVSSTGLAPGLDASSREKIFRAESLAGEKTSLNREQPYRRKDGSEIWGHLTVSLGRDLSSRPAFLIAMLADMTAQKNAEEHLREAEKMEVIGRLAGGIAHDFNNLLTGILLYCDLIIANLESGKRAEAGTNDEDGEGLPNSHAASELSKHIDEVRMAGEQGAALTQQLLAIARKQAAEPVPVKINELVMSTTNLLRRLIGRQAQLLTVLDPQAESVLADPGRLRQVIINLVLNARDALPDGGSIVLNTRMGNFPSDPLFPQAEIGIHRPAVALSVTDNGTGMDEETRSHLFEPFFTTKAPGMGTGLGLATVHRIVEESSGLISVSSAPGQGTCFEIFLPSLVAEIETEKEKCDAANPYVLEKDLTGGGREIETSLESQVEAPLESLLEASPQSAGKLKRASAGKQATRQLPRINLVRNNSHEPASRYQKPRGDRHV